MVKVVREKFLKAANLGDQEERQQFLSNLYVFLGKHIHEWLAIGVQLCLACLMLACSLRKCFSFGYVEAPPLIGFDIGQIKSFAEEAEEQGNFDIAAKHFQVWLHRNLMK